MNYVKTEWGWNVRYCRPATKEEVFHKSWETCMCSECSSKGNYGHFYCGRLKAAGYLMNLEREYWKYREALSKQKLADEEIRNRKADGDRNRQAVWRYASNHK